MIRFFFKLYLRHFVKILDHKEFAQKSGRLSIMHYRYKINSCLPVTMRHKKQKRRRRIDFMRSGSQTKRKGSST